MGTALFTTAAGADMTKPAGAIAAFGNSVPNLWKLAKKDYATPLAANHRLVLLIHETSGALSPATRRQLCNLTGYIDIDTILARGAYLTWTNQLLVRPRIHTSPNASRSPSTTTSPASCSSLPNPTPTLSHSTLAKPRASQ